jgi:hypothetical protein
MSCLPRACVLITTFWFKPVSLFTPAYRDQICGPVFFFAFALLCSYFFTFFTNQQTDLRLYFCLLLPLRHTHFIQYFWTSYSVIDIFILTTLHSHRLQSPSASVHCLCLSTRTYVLCITTVNLLFLYCHIRIKFIAGLRPQNPCHFSWQFSAWVLQTLRQSYLSHIVTAAT